jgi:hypothetical protein
MNKPAPKKAVKQAAQQSLDTTFDHARMGKLFEDILVKNAEQRKHSHTSAEMQENYFGQPKVQRPNIDCCGGSCSGGGEFVEALIQLSGTLEIIQKLVNHSRHLHGEGIYGERADSMLLEIGHLVEDCNEIIAGTGLSWDTP